MNREDALIALQCGKKLRQDTCIYSYNDGAYLVFNEIGLRTWLEVKQSHIHGEFIEYEDVQFKSNKDMTLKPGYNQITRFNLNQTIEIHQYQFKIQKISITEDGIRYHGLLKDGDRFSRGHFSEDALVRSGKLKEGV